MTQSHRLSFAERADLWRRWREGHSLSDIARALERPYMSLYPVVRARGGIAEAARRRASRALSLPQREEISLGVRAGMSLRQIAVRIGKAASTVSREIRRNGGLHAYRAAQAEACAWQRATRPKTCLLARHSRLRRYVARCLQQQQWSPQQISRRLEQQFPDDHSMRVSHETIYRSLFLQARGVLKKSLVAHLRRSRGVRRARAATGKGQGRGQIVDAISISQRPPEAQDRGVPGHWEGDLLSGAQNSHIATLVERHSRFVLLVKVPRRDTLSVTRSLAGKMGKLPAELRRSLTWDRGAELANHKQFTIATDIQVYFCDPQSPWQRGSNENTNGLLRQYFPKGTDLSVHSQNHLNAIARRLNGRPRETLKWRTPAEKLAETVAMTG